MGDLLESLRGLQVHLFKQETVALTVDPGVNAGLTLEALLAANGITPDEPFMPEGACSYLIIQGVRSLPTTWQDQTFTMEGTVLASSHGVPRGMQEILVLPGLICPFQAYLGAVVALEKPVEILAVAPNDLRVRITGMPLWDLLISNGSSHWNPVTDLPF